MNKNNKDKFLLATKWALYAFGAFLALTTVLIFAVVIFQGIVSIFKGDFRGDKLALIPIVAMFSFATKYIFESWKDHRTDFAFEEDYFPEFKGEFAFQEEREMVEV